MGHLSRHATSWWGGKPDPSPAVNQYLSIPFSNSPTLALICSKSAMTRGTGGGKGGKHSSAGGAEAEGGGKGSTSGGGGDFRFRRGMVATPRQKTHALTREFPGRRGERGSRRPRPYVGLDLPRAQCLGFRCTFAPLRARNLD